MFKFKWALGENVKQALFKQKLKSCNIVTILILFYVFFQKHHWSTIRYWICGMTRMHKEKCDNIQKDIWKIKVVMWSTDFGDQFEMLVFRCLRVLQIEEYIIHAEQFSFSLIKQSWKGTFGRFLGKLEKGILYSSSDTSRR